MISIEKELEKDRYLDFYIDFEQLENLLHIEHLRWNAFHFVNGWTKFTNQEMEQLSKSKNNKSVYGDRKDIKRKKHACLVSWEELINISDNFPYHNIYSSEKQDKKDTDKLGDVENRNFKEKYPQFKTYQLEDLEQVMMIPECLDYANLKVKHMKTKYKMRSE